jgi:hypothetical protein
MLTLPIILFTGTPWPRGIPLGMNRGRAGVHRVGGCFEKSRI